MHRALSTTLLLSLACACGAPAAPEAPSPSASPASIASDAEPTSDDEAPSIQVGDEAAEPEAAPTAGLPSEDALGSKPSLDPTQSPFPKIDAVTADLGKPALAGIVQRMEFRFEPRPLGKTYSCDTLDVLRLPTGAAAFDRSVYTSNECKGLKGTTAKLREALVSLGARPQAEDGVLDWMIEEVAGKPFDAVVAAFEKALGKAPDRGDVPLAGWRYVGTDETCKLLLVTESLRSRAGQALWGMPCE